MKWLFIILGVLLALILICWIIGALLPRDHIASASIKLKAPPEQIWPIISDLEHHSDWQSGYKKVERLPDRDGKPVYKMIGAGAGADAITLMISESSPPSKLVTTIADDSLPFGGTWTWEITPDGDGSRVTITERGFVKPAIFRFVGKFFMGYDSMIKTTLRDLAKKLGESSAQPE